jgi:glycosyltransferase involved in cell wall biosynthesis
METRAEFGLTTDAIVAVTLGRFVEQKGHRHLIEALAQIKDQIANLQLLWCGDGPLRSELESLAVMHGVGERIVFAGMLDDVTDALNCADLMIHPSIEEPFGIAVLEGMRAGLPVIASNVGGIPEVLGDTGNLVEPQNPASLATAMQSMMADRDQWKTIGAVARSRFEQQFSLEAMISRVEQYCLSMLQTEKRHG